MAFSMGMPASGSGFGFGSTTTANTNTTSSAAAPTSLFSFGNTATNTSTSTSASGSPSLRRSLSNPGTTPLFGTALGGANANSSRPRASAITSGTSIAQPSSTSTNPPGSFFGTTTTSQPATTTNVFGTSTTGQGSLFGSNPASQPATSSTSLFGSTTSTAANNPTLTSTAPAFGSTSTGLFGRPTTTSATTPAAGLAFSQNTNGSNTLTPGTQPGAAPIWDQIMQVKEAWNPNSPLCQFKHYFYNLVDPTQIHLYTCPPDHDPALWAQAQQDNPDPTCLVPALAVGFGDLQKRAEQQKHEAELHTAKLEEISAKLSQLNNKHTLENLAKLVEFKRRNQEQSYRILKLMKMMQIVRYSGQTLRPEEEMIRVRLERIMNELVKPGQLQRKTQDLWAQAQSLLVQRQRLHHTPLGTVRYEVTSNEDLEKCVNILDNYQAGLSQLTSVMQQDLQDVQKQLANTTT
ncbi:hypothetical protein IWQ61_005831 [Dispira simplex]|nr:hypothetical protein IWQ61_005831 [Dispira simplex]